MLQQVGYQVFLAVLDVYVSYYLDEYFTNGLELYYKTANHTNYPVFDKKINPEEYFSVLNVDEEIIKPYICSRLKRYGEVAQLVRASDS